MLSDADKAWMREAMAEVVNDDPVSITLRRGTETLPAQTFRVERGGGGRGTRLRRPGSEEARTSIVLVSADPAVDVQKDDRFSLDGQLYRVLLVRPNDIAGTQAEADLEQ